MRDPDSQTDLVLTGIILCVLILSVPLKYLALYELYSFVSVHVFLTLYPSLCILLGIIIANNTALCVMTHVP